jgi:sulfhydrogenase subunit delta
MSKPRVAIFDFACCEGCQLQIVNLEAEIIDLVSAIDVVEWREAMSEQSDEYDIAIIEGSITRPEDEVRIKEIRSRAKVLIALGACATMGGINKLKNNFSMDDVRECVYGEDGTMPHLNTQTTKSVGEVVKVDYKIPGCPINGQEFVSIVRELLVGKQPSIPNNPVCVECKIKGNVCRFEYNEICLGPITLGGCEAKCPSGGMWCYGCRGFVADPNIDAAQDVMTKYGKTIKDLESRMTLYNSK